MHLFDPRRNLALSHRLSVITPQITPSEPLAEPGLHGERAMLIKNGRGDWGIVAGRWNGFKRRSSKYIRTFLYNTTIFPKYTQKHSVTHP